MSFYLQMNAFLFRILGMLVVVVSFAVASPVQGQQVTAPERPKPQYLAFKTIDCGGQSRDLVLISMRKGIISQKTLPEGIAFTAPAERNIIRETDPDHYLNLKSSNEAAKNWTWRSFGQPIGTETIILFDKHGPQSPLPRVVPVYGLTFYSPIRIPNARTLYVGSITGTSERQKVLVTLVGIFDRGKAQLATHVADLSIPYGAGLYDGENVQVMTKDFLRPSPLMAQLAFEIPDIDYESVSLDSIAVNEEELLVAIRLEEEAGFRHPGGVTERYFKLDLRTKEWKDLDAEPR